MAKPHIMRERGFRGDSGYSMTGFEICGLIFFSLD